MDAVYRNQRHIYDATRKYFLLGRDRLIEGLEPPDGGAVLEIACGTGRNLIVAARRYPKAQFFGFDISTEMLKSAQSKVERAGLDGRIVLAAGDATAFEPAALFGVERFERIFLSYSLSMIPPWREAISEAFRHLAPGGSLHVVDFGRQEGLPGWFRFGLEAWLRRFHVEPREKMEVVLNEMARSKGAGLYFERLYRDYTCRAVIYSM